MEVPLKDESKLNTWVTRLILISLRSLWPFLYFSCSGILSLRMGAFPVRIYLIIMGCILATICAYLILLKYQKLIQQFGRDNVSWGKGSEPGPMPWKKPMKRCARKLPKGAGWRRP